MHPLGNIADFLTVVWFVLFAAMGVTVAAGFALKNQLTSLFMRYGSIVLPNVIDLVSVNTPSNHLQLQRYILTKAYKEEAQPALREKGKTVRMLSIVAILLFSLWIVITAVLIWS